MVHRAGYCWSQPATPSFSSRPTARVPAPQVRAVRAANSELLWLYWSVGRDIPERQDQAGWGSRVVDRLATDSVQELLD